MKWEEAAVYMHAILTGTYPPMPMMYFIFVELPCQQELGEKKTNLEMLKLLSAEHNYT